MIGDPFLKIAVKTKAGPVARWIKILFDQTYERETEEGSKGMEKSP
jgi:hypothetical protein